MTVPATFPDAKPALRAAVLLWARDLVGAEGPWPRTVADVLAQTGAGRSQTYDVLGRLRHVAAALGSPPGRPPAEVPPEAVVAVLQEERDFLMDHPGAVAGRGVRRNYSDAFRRFVIGLVAAERPGASLTVERLADTLAVPLGTLKNWLRCPETPAEAGDAPAADDTSAPADPLAPAHPFTTRPDIATILVEWQSWEGYFDDFCRRLREQHRLPFGNTFIATVLEAVGLRSHKPRRPPAAPWSRGTFRTLFPGAQWIGDGTTVALRLDDELFAFNVEAIVDPAPGCALVGVTVTDTEDEQAVLDAFEHGCTTTGEPPLGFTLDNRPSNHSPAVEQGVAPATLLHATPGRGQAKAPTEGAFGLFRQTAPPLVVQGSTRRELARSILVLVYTLWAWTRNGKPRRRLGGRSPAQAYHQDLPSQQELDQARAWIAELRRREELARTTRSARNDPVRRQLLAQGLDNLGIPDPDGRLAASLACYATDAILHALAAFAAKKELGTLPPDADPGRYFGGMVRKMNERLELEHTAATLLALRLRHRELTLEPLRHALDHLRASLPAGQLLQTIIDRALEATPLIDFRFWARAAEHEIAKLTLTHAAGLYRQLAQRIAASFATDRDRRAHLIQALPRALAEAA